MPMAPEAMMPPAGLAPMESPAPMGGAAGMEAAPMLPPEGAAKMESALPADKGATGTPKEAVTDLLHQLQNLKIGRAHV